MATETEENWACLRDRRPGQCRTPERVRSPEFSGAHVIEGFGAGSAVIRTGIDHNPSGCRGATWGAAVVVQGRGGEAGVQTALVEIGEDRSDAHWSERCCVWWGLEGGGGIGGLRTGR